MLERPRLLPHLRWSVVPPDQVLLLSEHDRFALRGPLFARTVPLLDGTRTVDELVRALDGELPPATVYAAVALLERKGYVVESGGSLADGEAAFWSAAGTPPSVAAGRLALTSVGVTVLGEAVSPEVSPAVLLATLLTSQGVRTVAEGEHLQVVFVDDYEDPRLAPLNREALRTGRPWLLCRPRGATAWLGPLFLPGSTGCWACLEQRLRLNHRVEAFARERAVSGPPADPALPSAVQACLALLATAITRQLVTGSCSLDGKVVTLDPLRLALDEHRLVRRPQCAACGDPSGRMAPAFDSTRPSPKRFLADGGHRTRDPDATVAAFGHHVSRITGVVGTLFRVTDPADDVLHVYGSGPNGGLVPRSLAALRRRYAHGSMGKGVSASQAKASALCEAIERYSGAWQGDEVVRTASFRALGEAAVDPRGCLLFSEAQYGRRAGGELDTDPFDYVPEPFDEDAEIDWTPVLSLTRDEVLYVPAQMTWFGYPVAPGERCFAIADSNGNAAGNTLDEAVVHGFLELVERDAVAVWWYNRLRRPGIDLASFDEPWLLAVQERHRQLGRRLWVLDLTHDLGIPACAAVSARDDEHANHIYLGFGAHLDARIAVLRAVTELGQMFAGAEIGGETQDGDEIDSWLETATPAHHPHLAPADGAPLRRASDFPRLWSDDLRDDLAFCRSVVERRGLEMLVLDQTRPDVGLPVARVVVPGLRHFWPRFAPGRLYEVPMRLGWLDRALREDELDPTPLPF